MGIHTLLGTNTTPTPIQDGSWEDDFSSFIGWDMNSFPGVNVKGILVVKIKDGAKDSG